MPTRISRIAIVGGGPRGLTLLDQLALAAGSFAGRLDVVVYDPNEPGEGAHPAGQHPCLLTNTLASQVTIYAPTQPSDVQSPPTGPSFTDWARAAGYRRVQQDFLVTDDGEPISDDDYLPRALLGLYLRDAFRNIVARMPPNVTVRHQRDTVVDIELGDGGPAIVKLKSGASHEADFLLLTTGHCEEKPSTEHQGFADFAARHGKTNPRLAFVQYPYPLNRLDQIAADSVVAVQGLGLTAYDVIASLTLARGGRYQGDGSELSYLASGNEPKIKLFSRNGLPYAARGKNQKGIAGRHAARFFTPAAIEKLRIAREQQSGTPALDFRLDVLPLLKREMAYAYRITTLGAPVEPEDFQPSFEESSIIDEILDPRAPAQCGSFDEFKRLMQRWLVDDLREAYRGNLTSALKASTDVIRDVRDGLAAAVEHGGLEPQSHRWFCENFIATMNRVSFGPPRHRNAELLALIRAGIVEWAGGPGCVVAPSEDTAQFAITTPYPRSIQRTLADVLVIGRLPAYSPDRDASPLSAALLKRGLIRPFRNGDYSPSGLALDAHQHPVNRDGVALANVWVLGYPAEGSRFYTHALPRPQRRATQNVDAERAIAGLLAMIGSRTTLAAKADHAGQRIERHGSGAEFAA